MGGSGVIRLSGPVESIGIPPKGFLVGRVTTDLDAPQSVRRRRIFLDRTPESSSVPDGFAAVISPSALRDTSDGLVIKQPDWASYLTDGDVVALTPDLSLCTLYRRAASANSLLVTERCSSNCIMCSQPPKARDDSWLYDLAISAIEHIPEDASEIGITGGEPLLDASKFLALVYRLKTMLPRTAVHVLSNGRLLAYLRYAQAIQSLKHHDLMIGIPLYSASPARHDFVVQAKGAFDQTVRGILNAKRCGIKIEIRVVLHEQTVPTLRDLGRFIARNLPFVDQVVLMGLEHIGYVKPNSGVLKLHPRSYSEELAAVISTLRAAGIRTHVFNLPLCFLPEAAWPVAQRSISDWKNDLPTACAECAVRDDCGGFFTWNVAEFADSVQPFLPERARMYRMTSAGVR